MQPVNATQMAPASGAPYQLTQTEMVRRGRWRSWRRAAWMTLFLAVLQLPSRLVATGHLTSVDGSIPGWVTVRIALLIDLAMVLAYLIVAARARELVRFAPDPKPERTRARAAMALVVLAAAWNVAQDVYLWVATGTKESAVMHTPWALPHWSLAAVGLVLGFVASWRATMTSTADPLTYGPAPKDPDLVVCCSGGGIRAAAFSLGGLQALEDRYNRADSVIGVSGGGYIAAAFHVHRWKSPGPPESEDPASRWGNEGLAFAPGTPEEAWLRRHTRYLVDSPGAGVFAVLSLLYGLAVNLLFISAILGATAWLAAWFFLASGAVTGWPEAPEALQFGQGWGWVQWVWAVAALGVALFFAGKSVDRFPNTVTVTGRSRVRSGVVALVVIGSALAAALLVLPWVLVWLHDFAVHPPTGSIPAALAQLLTAMGFAARNSAGTQGVAPPGVAVPSASFVAIVAAVLACLRAISASLTPADGKTSWLGKALERVWGAVKSVVIPWMAAVAVVVLLVAVFLTWTVALLNDPTHLQSWGVVGWYIVAVVLTFLLTDANRTSLHHYYRERLSSAYLVGQDGAGLPKPVDYRQPLRFSMARPPAMAGPKLVACAVANASDLDVVPTGRDCTPFVFSHDRIGLTEPTLPDRALVDTGLYEFASDGQGRDATIPAAVAISGAAFSPLAGRENVKVRPYRLVLALANARLGVWLPNPLWVNNTVEEERRTGADERAKEARRAAADHEADGERPAAANRDDNNHDRNGPLGIPRWLKDTVAKPSPFLVAREGFGRTSVLDRYLYVTDGGHYDNLGLVEALRRRARTILVLDASNDDEDTFQALGEAIATARMDLGCEVRIDPLDMRRVKDGRAKADWVRGTITYRKTRDQSEPDTGQLWVAKAVMVDGLPWDVESYQGKHPDFPRTSTGKQLYGEFDLEAYRELGHEVVLSLLSEADKDPDGPLSRDWPRQRQCLTCRRTFDVVAARWAYNSKFLGLRDYRSDAWEYCAACAIAAAKQDERRKVAGEKSKVPAQAL